MPPPPFAATPTPKAEAQARASRKPEAPARAPKRGLWFPTAPAVLLLLARPGAVLLALGLFGQESAVNGWLQQHLGLSYHSAVRAWGGLLLLLVPPLLVLL